MTRGGEREFFIFLSPHRVSPFSRGVIFTRALVSLALLSLRTNGGLPSEEPVQRCSTPDSRPFAPFKVFLASLHTKITGRFIRLKTCRTCNQAFFFLFRDIAIYGMMIAARGIQVIKAAA